ncbi:unnamed protein product [Penicillium pancosmium]
MPSSHHHQVPWMICRLDKRASIGVPLLTNIINEYEDTLGESNPNCIVIWHCVCMLICVDGDVLARAAGREGPNSMNKARRELISWTQTDASRRACIHAAQTFRILSHRKPADGTAFQSVRTLFMSALVLGFYLLAKESSPVYSPVHEDVAFDLSNTDVDWKTIGEEGFSESPKFPISENAAVRFIHSGGPIVMDGKKYQSGARHAKRIILEFASLLDEVGSHWMADYAQLLYSIHDTIEDQKRRIDREHVTYRGGGTVNSGRATLPAFSISQQPRKPPKSPRKRPSIHLQPIKMSEGYEREQYVSLYAARRAVPSTSSHPSRPRGGAAIY